jgi:transposase
LHPDIQKAYNLAHDLRNIFEKTTDKIMGLSRLAKWHEKVNKSGFKSFNTILTIGAQTLQLNLSMLK